MDRNQFLIFCSVGSSLFFTLIMSGRDIVLEVKNSGLRRGRVKPEERRAAVRENGDAGGKGYPTGTRLRHRITRFANANGEAEKFFSPTMFQRSQLLHS